MNKVPKVGDTVSVRTFTNKIVTGTVVHVWEHAEGWCVRVVSGSVVYNVALEQVINNE